MSFLQFMFAYWLGVAVCAWTMTLSKSKKSQRRPAANLLQLITDNFGCLYCRNFYYNKDGSAGCLKNIPRPDFKKCFNPDIQKIKEVLNFEISCNRAQAREDRWS